MIRYKQHLFRIICEVLQMLCFFIQTLLPSYYLPSMIYRQEKKTRCKTIGQNVLWKYIPPIYYRCRGSDPRPATCLYQPIIFLGLLFSFFERKDTTYLGSIQIFLGIIFISVVYFSIIIYTQMPAIRYVSFLWVYRTLYSLLFFFLMVFLTYFLASSYPQFDIAIQSQ